MTIATRVRMGIFLENRCHMASFPAAQKISIILFFMEQEGKRTAKIQIAMFQCSNTNKIICVYVVT